MNYNRIETTGNFTAYYLDDHLNRTDGPAVEYNNGSKEYYLNGKLHRIDGPAVEFNDGEKAWFIHGKEYSEQSFNDYLSNLKIPEYFSQLN